MPTVVFTEMPVEFETKVIRRFLRGDWKKYVLNIYPEMKNLNSKSLGEIILGIHNRKAREIAESRERFQKAWGEIEKDCFNLMQEIVGTEWPTNRPIITGMISINPICPRFLDKWSFSISYGFETRRALIVIAHEALHFLYFKKWAELHPESHRKNWESPHLEWLLSELVAPIVLNDPRMQKLLTIANFFYPEHEVVKIDGKTAPQYFTEIYLRHIGEKNGFELFLNEAFKKLKQYWPKIGNKQY